MIICYISDRDGFLLLWIENHVTSTGGKWSPWHHPWKFSNKKQWRSHPGQGGSVPLLTEKNLPKIGKNRGKDENREERTKSGRFFDCPSLQRGLATLLHRKHGSESVRKTESFDSFFVREMTHRGLKCVTSHCVISRTKNESNDSGLHTDSLWCFLCDRIRSLPQRVLTTSECVHLTLLHKRSLRPL